MSFAKNSAVALAFSLLLSSNAFAGAAGGGTELPSNAEPNKAKNSSERSMDKGAMKNGDMQQGNGSMQKGGGDMKKNGDRMP